MEAEILQFITYFNAQKIGVKFPEYVTFQEINILFKPVDINVMRKLCSEKKLLYGRTLNSIWFLPNIAK